MFWGNSGIADGKDIKRFHFFKYQVYPFDMERMEKVMAYFNLQPHLDFGLKILGGDVMAIPGIYCYVQVLGLLIFMVAREVIVERILSSSDMPFP